MRPRPITADTMLVGRQSYETFAGIWPKREAAGGEDAGTAKKLGDTRKIVVSNQELELTWRDSEPLERRDIAAFAEQFAENARYEMPFGESGAASALDGRAAIRSAFDQMPALFSSVEIRDFEIFPTTTSGTYFAEFRGVFMVSRTGAPHDSTYVMKFELADGRVFRCSVPDGRPKPVPESSSKKSGRRCRIGAVVFVAGVRPPAGGGTKVKEPRS